MNAPPSRANTNATAVASESADCSVRATAVMAPARPATTRAEATISSTTPAGSPQSAPSASDVTAQMTIRLLTPTTTTPAPFPARMAASLTGPARTRSSRPMRFSVSTLRAMELTDR